MAQYKHMNSKEIYFVRSTLAISFLLSIILSFIQLYLKTKWSLITLFLCFFFVLTWLLVTYRSHNQKSVDLFIVIAVINALIIVPELALRIVDFRYDAGIQFGYPRARHFIHYDYDEKLFWKIKSTIPGVNSLGFPGEEITVPKPKNVFRILFLGDSVTQQGYPEIVEYFLNLKYPDNPGKFESIILAVSGYSTHQGRILSEDYALQFEPDLALVYFGWNDHWQAFGSADAQKNIKVSKSLSSKLFRLVYHKMRILQGLNWAIVSLTNSKSSATGEPRVPPNQYAKNLHQIQHVFDLHKIPVIFITAPTSHYKLGVPDYLVRQNFVQNKESATRLHKNYNQIVRDVAQACGSLVLDLETEFSMMPSDTLKAMFLDDGIHLTTIGLASVAKRVFDFIEINVIGSEESAQMRGGEIEK
jgi:lysophospholipase L1-like esterase